MRPIVLALGLLLAGPVAARAATPTPVAISDVVVERIGTPASPALRVTARVETRSAALPSIRVTLFGRDGRLRAGGGQGQDVRPPDPDGVRRYPFSVDIGVAERDLLRLADRVVMQVGIGEETASAMLHARFVGLRARPFGLFARDACLAPVRGGPAVREARLSAFMAGADARYRLWTCIAAPAGARLVEAVAAAHILKRQEARPTGPLTEVDSGGSVSIPGLLPLQGGLRGMPATLAILGVDVTVPPKEGPLYPWVPVEFILTTCREPAGPACTRVETRRQPVWPLPTVPGTSP